mmetsp:Transcript_38469/g.105988  ORF Transcript_38469/g.105988 Transcript_38469/m.105988 type:complete len:171 (+) Transcript_38469:46-558(+)
MSLPLPASAFVAVALLHEVGAGVTSVTPKNLLYAVEVEQNLTWFDGCTVLDRRGQTAYEFQTKNFRDQMYVCLKGCSPPGRVGRKEGCNTHTAFETCDCLKCMMWCLHRGTYNAQCDYVIQAGICMSAKDEQQAANGGMCDVDCSLASGVRPVLATMMLLFPLWCTWGRK